jgi:hypothetical protein
MSTSSEILLVVALVVLLVGLALPGWDTARLPKRAVRRRIYWTATVIGIVLLFVAGLPDLRNSVTFSVAAAILTIGWAYSRTPNIKIGGRILAAYEPNREPDPPAAGDRS